MLDQDEREVARQAADDLGHGHAVGRRESRGGLVEQQQARLRREREREFELALLAVRQRAQRYRAAILHAGAFERLFHFVALLAARRAVAEERVFPARESAHRKADVVLDGEPGKEVGDLEGAAHAPGGALMRAAPRDVAAAERHAPGRDRHFAGDGVEERRLARAVRADDGAALTGRHGQRDVVHGAQRAEGDSHAVELQKRRRVHAARFPPVRLRPSHVRS